LMMLFGAKVNAGFCEPDFCPEPRYFMPFPQQTHEIHVFLRLMGFLGIPLQGDHLEFPLLADDVEEFQRLSSNFNLVPKRYICIHAGARLLTRRWPVENFALVANRLGAQGWTIVLTGSTDEEALVGEVSRRLKHVHINLAGKTSLGALGVVVKNAALLISNDTGVAHIASAVEVPSVVVVSGSDPVRWSPLNAALHKTVVHPVDCRPCFEAQCPFDLKCAWGVEPEHVNQEAQMLLIRKVSDEKAITDPHMACPR
ncbi:MAG: glycosyltransferase family 9 protein, partial [Candidatus Omnitrophica bacterium]|nr:glycosyltransferase family 9 protein [Candidatus Omnitrophota bacterium]